jgi:hypothetical protein
VAGRVWQAGLGLGGAASRLRWLGAACPTFSTRVSYAREARVQRSGVVCPAGLTREFDVGDVQWGVDLSLGAGDHSGAALLPLIGGSPCGGFLVFRLCW